MTTSSQKSWRKSTTSKEILATSPDSSWSANYTSNYSTGTSNTPPHKVIFCISWLADDTEKWWELCARIIGRTIDGEQLYPTYEDFKTNLRERFWKDADEQIKRAQWEKLRQVNFQDSDQFFQQFEELAYYAGICDNKQVMIAQIKKAAHETSKNTIYMADGEVLTSYEGWKARLLHMDYNWCLKQVEGTTAVCTNSKSQASKMTMPQKGGQTLSTPERKTATGMTYGGHGVPMDVDAAKCFRCGKLGHFKHWWASRLCTLRIRGFTHPSPNTFEMTPL